MQTRLLSYISITLICFFTTACVAPVHKQSKQQTLAELLADTDWQNAQQNTEMANALSLVEHVKDEHLKNIIKSALENNLDLRLAKEKLNESGLLEKSLKYNYLPELNGEIGASRHKTSSNIRSIENEYSGTLFASWELDIWGKRQQERRATQEDLAIELANYQAAKQSVVANIVRSWFKYANQYHRVNIQKRRLALLHHLVEVTENDYQQGFKQLNEVYQLQAREQQAQATLAQHQQEALVVQYQVQALLGTYPNHLSQWLPMTTPLNLLLNTKLPKIQIGLPAHIIHQRPDIQSAWHQVEAANARTKIQYWNMYPSINITGQRGKTSSDFGRLMDQPSIWNIAGMIKLPLFSAGRLKHNYLAANSRAEQSYITFLQSVLSALHEIETKLAAEKQLEKQEVQLRQALTYEQLSANQAEKDYRVGAITLSDFINRQLSVLDVLEQTTDLINQRVQNRIDLNLALGQGI